MRELDEFGFAGAEIYVVVGNEQYSLRRGGFQGRDYHVREIVDGVAQEGLTSKREESLKHA